MGMFKRRGRLLFVNKKKQKNILTLGRAGFSAAGPSEQKFFAPLFSKKRLPSCFKLNRSGSKEVARCAD
jgi:hypothetical protein